MSRKVIAAVSKMACLQSIRWDLAVNLMDNACALGQTYCPPFVQIFTVSKEARWQSERAFLVVRGPSGGST